MEEKKTEWESFVRRAKTKTSNHTTMVRFYNAIYNFMIMTVILLAGVLTCLILLGGMGKDILAPLSGSCTILTAISKFLIADRKKAGHKRYAKIFQNLLIRMLKCEKITEYNVLWSELHENIIKEPLVLIWQRRSKRTKIVYTMAPRLMQAFEGKEEPEPPNNGVQQGYNGNQPGYPGTQQRYSGIHQGYNGAYQGHNSSQQGYIDTQQGYNGAQHAHSQQGRHTPANNRPNDFNPNDFHVMSIEDQVPGQPTPNRNNGYVAISGLPENVDNQDQEMNNEQISEETTPFVSSPSKGKKKKGKTDVDKPRQQYQGSSSQGTLHGIEEEEEYEDQNNQEPSDSVALTKQKKTKKKKGQSKASPQDLPLPPPSFDEDDDEYHDHEQHKTGKIYSSRSTRSTSSKNDRTIVYDEEEENYLSEDTDDLEDTQSYKRN